MTALFLTGAALLMEGGLVHGHGVLLDGGRIVSVLANDALPCAERRCLPSGSLLAPGLIDIQVNGGGGLLFNDSPTQETARAIAAAHRRLGTTSILPTLITDAPSVMRQAAGVMNDAKAGILGLHFEGPFISREKPGVHPSSYIRAPEEADLCLLEQLGGRPEGSILLTVAPEIVPDSALRRLTDARVIICAGHSAASYERAMDALSAGVNGFTHLFNAMTPLVARAPGLAAAALTHADSYCGVIADGIHVHPAMLRLLLDAKPDRTILVSDAMPPTGTAMMEFELQGRIIQRHGGSLRTQDGTLAGADICLADAVRFCVRKLGLPIARALHMATAAPADFLGRAADIGRIAPGLQADLVLLSPELEVLGTWLAGHWQEAA